MLSPEFLFDNFRFEIPKFKKKQSLLKYQNLKKTISHLSSICL